MCSAVLENELEDTSVFQKNERLSTPNATVMKFYIFSLLNSWLLKEYFEGNSKKSI